MKLRIKGNSIRLRLGQDEVQRLARGERVAEVTHFPEAQLVYTVSASGRAYAASFRDGRLAVTVPESEALTWAASQQVSLTGEVAAGGATLNLLVEKDFACVDPRADDAADSYPNPKLNRDC